MEYIKHLLKDKKLATIIQEEVPSLKKQKNIPLRLIASIMSQQLSTKVAAVIYKRFLSLYGESDPTPLQVLQTSNESLRAIGMSNAKVSYVKNVAEFCIEQSISDKVLAKMNNEEIIQHLVTIKGVGKWTVEMLLMFSLGREDVFAVDDLGIQQAMIKLYKLKPLNKKELKENMLQLSAKWSPYRTYACMHLWKWKDQAKLNS